MSVVPLGFANGFFQVKLAPLPPATLALLPFYLLLRPALVEELIFRVLLLPRDASKVSRRYLVTVSLSALALFVASHPLHGWLTRPAAIPLFTNPVFLACAALLGAACTLTYLVSRSLWPSVLLHWSAVLIWIAFLGGQGLIGQRVSGSFSFEKQIGIAVAGGQGNCLAIYDPSLKPGTKFVLVHQPSITDLAETPEVKEATIVERLAKSCDDHVDNGDRDGADLTFYRIQFEKEPWGSLTIAFAIFDPRGTVTVREGKVDADLDADGTKESFRVCASNEGVHHQVWTGAPLEGRPRWHWYFYAGYDTAFTCSERDYFGPK